MFLLRQAVCALRNCRISYGCAGVLTSLLDISDGVGVIAKIESINALSDALRHKGHKGFAQCSDGAGFRTLWVGRKTNVLEFFLITFSIPNSQALLQTTMVPFLCKKSSAFGVFFRLSTTKLHNIQPGLSSFPELFSGESPRGDFSELGGMLSSEQMAATTEKIAVDERKGVTHNSYHAISYHVMSYHTISSYT